MADPARTNCPKKQLPGTGKSRTEARACARSPYLRTEKASIRAETVPRLDALEYVTAMRGGSSSHLVRCSDGEFYVVKFPDNPQGSIILANEFLAGRIAGLLELPVPRPAVINITEKFLKACPKLLFRLPSTEVDCKPGFAFGSCYQAQVFKGNRDLVLSPQDHLPSCQFCLVENRDDFMGMLVFDKWTCNCDGRQVIYASAKRPGTYRAYMIDNGACFDGNEWDFPDSPRRGLYFDRAIYKENLKLSSLRPWLTRLEKITPSDLEGCADNLPAAWYGYDLTRLERLLDKLDRRRQHVTELILATLDYYNGDDGCNPDLARKKSEIRSDQPRRLRSLMVAANV